MELTTTTTTTHTLTLDDGRTFDLSWKPVTHWYKDDALYVVHEGDGTVVIGYVTDDPDPANPREDYDHLGTFPTWHRSYLLGDERPAAAPDEYLLGLAEEADPSIMDIDLNDTEALNDAMGKALAESFVVLPVYLYDHSGLTISAAPYGDPFDSGILGFLYARLGTEETKDMSREDVLAALHAEVAEYDDYLRGDVYGVVTEVHSPVSGNVTVESLWSVIGDEHAMELAVTLAQEAADKN